MTHTAWVRVPYIGGFSTELRQLPARLNPPAKPHRLASDWQVEWNGVWRRVEKDGRRLFVHVAGGRAYLDEEPK